MIESERPTAAPFVPPSPTLVTLRTAAKGCVGCHLYRSATQTVFGEGLETARVMLIGEQPGDKEDLEGRPFVGPAGRLLNQALDEAGALVLRLPDGNVRTRPASQGESGESTKSPAPSRFRPANRGSTPRSK